MSEDIIQTELALERAEEEILRLHDSRGKWQSEAERVKAENIALKALAGELTDNLKEAERYLSLLAVSVPESKLEEILKVTQSAQMSISRAREAWL